MTRRWRRCRSWRRRRQGSRAHDVVLWLWNEAVTLGRKGTADHLIGVNLAPLKDLAAVQAAQIPIWVCGACAVARQIGAGMWPVRLSRACRTTSRR